MRDKVFIAWSGDSTIANEVKQLLENMRYRCFVGGNDCNDSTRFSIGETVLQQIKTCNQAIIIFQNRNNGQVSPNVFFELGFALALYGQQKVHCVKFCDDVIDLPSDFENSYVKKITVGEEKTFAQGIVDYFLGRQKMSVHQNKMRLMNERYLIHEKIQEHYSENGSKCSDYELAQYILYYTQAAQMFGDEQKIHDELVDFKRENTYYLSSELMLSLKMCISFLNMVLNIREYEDDHGVYLEEHKFWKYIRDNKSCLNSLEEDEFGIFDEWAKMFLHEHAAYAYMLGGNNREIPEDLRKECYENACDMAFATLEDIKILTERAPVKEHHDDVGLLALIRAYVYRNLYISKRNLGIEDAMEYLERTKQEREDLKNHFEGGSLDTKLYNILCMEYYLSVIEYLDAYRTEEANRFEVRMYRDEILAYLDTVKREDQETAYLHQIQSWCRRAEKKEELN